VSVFLVFVIRSVEHRLRADLDNTSGRIACDAVRIYDCVGV